MRAPVTLSILLSLWSLAGCASTRPAEEEPADPTGALAVQPEETPEAAAPSADAPSTGAGGLTFQGLDVRTDDRPATPLETAAEGAATCPEGQAPLSVKLLVLLRHPNDPVPALPADGFSLAVDGKPAASGVRVGQVHTLCVPPGEHELAVSGGKLARTVRASAPGHANLPVAGGGPPPPPTLPADPSSPVPTPGRVLP
jgi:hypothetical protein